MIVLLQIGVGLVAMAVAFAVIVTSTIIAVRVTNMTLDHAPPWVGVAAFWLVVVVLVCAGLIMAFVVGRAAFP